MIMEDNFPSRQEYRIQNPESSSQHSLIFYKIIIMAKYFLKNSVFCIQKMF
jgi:hypothetical protein